MITPPLRQRNSLVVGPSEYARGNTDREQPATRWLGIWLDRGLTFRRHVEGRCSLGDRVASHLRHLANTVCGPPPDAVRKRPPR